MTLGGCSLSIFCSRGAKPAFINLRHLPSETLGAQGVWFGAYRLSVLEQTHAGDINVLYPRHLQ